MSSSIALLTKYSAGFRRFCGSPFLDGHAKTNALTREGRKVNITENLKIFGVSMLLVAGLAACEKQNPGPAESAGKNIDRTMDQAGKKIGDAVDKVGDKMGEQSMKAGVAIDDTEITAKIKAAFLAESGLKTLQISVDTVKGVVTLSGSVEKQSQSDMAMAMAGAVSGVSQVNNQLVVILRN
jgi:hypothetical protein